MQQDENITKGKIFLTDKKNIYKDSVISYAEITYDVNENGNKAILYCKDSAGILKAIYNINNPSFQCIVWEE